MLSIIIPVRNESDNIQSVFDYFLYNLKNLKYEVLIINDYSEDDTLDKTKKLVEKHKEFKVFDNSIKGLGGAINLGIENANYIVDFIKDMTKVFPTLKDDWGIYVPEVKYLAPEPLVDYKNLSLTKYPNVHFVGDALSARGISVSGAHGTLVAEQILKNK